MSCMFQALDCSKQVPTKRLLLVPGIPQMWVKVKVAQSYPTLWLHGVYICSPWNSLGQTPGVGSLSLLQGIFQTQRLNPGLPPCRQILYYLSHKGIPRILEWVAYPFSSGSSQLRNRTKVSGIAGEFFTNWAIREALMFPKLIYNFSTILIRFIAGVICRIDKVFVEFMWNCRNSKWSR